jgi:hypothetical protein
MNEQQRDDKLEELVGMVRKIDEALLGTYTKRGFITRLRSVERVMKYLGGIVLTATTLTTTILIRNLLGMGG